MVKTKKYENKTKDKNPSLNLGVHDGTTALDKYEKNPSLNLGVHDGTTALQKFGEESPNYVEKEGKYNAPKKKN